MMSWIKFLLPTGLNATITYLSERTPFNPMSVLSDEYRCITMDLSNAYGGGSSGPVEVDRQWDSYADDQLGLMDHLGIDKFLVLGFCIGGPFIWKMLQRAPQRVIAAVPAMPSGFRPEVPDLFYRNNMKNWAPALCEKRPDVTKETCSAFLRRNNSGANKRPPSEVEKFYLPPASRYCVQQLRVQCVVGRRAGRTGKGDG